MLERIESNKAPKAVGSYSPATKIRNLIFTSGQVPINRETGKIDFPGEIEKQAEQAMKNIKYILEDNGSTMDHVVKATVYLQDIKNFVAFDNVYKTFFNGNYPSRTAFEVGNLPLGAMVEIEVIAEIAEK